MSERLGWKALLATRSAELSRDLNNWIFVGLAASIAFPSRIPPRKGLFGQPLGQLEVTLKLRNGYRLKCRLDELEGYYAAFVQREYDGVVRDWSSVESIIDVGANVGAATLWFARRAPAARLLAIEPNADVFPRLVNNIGHSGLQDRVTPVAAAIGVRAGLATVVNEKWSVLTTTRAGVEEGRPAVVQLTLAELVDSFGVGKINLLKLDCEGAEYDALLSATRALLRQFQAIVAECHPVTGHHVSELEDHLKDAGFTVQVSEKTGQAGMLSAVRSKT
jgi:FkbM family methyltransferase